MFKKLLTTLALSASLIASACWFGENYTGTLEDNYIYGLSGDAVHYEPTGPNSYKITNGQTVAMPFTVFIKVSPHSVNGAGAGAAAAAAYISEESGTENKITKAVLQYKLIKKSDSSDSSDSDSSKTATGWVTVKTIENPDWDMDFSEPVALFGRDTINVPGLTEDTVMLIRLYLTDGTYATGDLDEEIDPQNIPNNAIGFGYSDKYSPATGFTYGSSSAEEAEAEEEGIKASTWSAPFVMKITVKANAGKKPVKRPRR